MIANNKIFVVGLPRTGTTSVCHALLQAGIKTAHTSYTQNCFAQATAIADTPVFNDYAQLDKLYANAKFIYLTRESAAWIPSIRQLLLRMHTNLTRPDGGFNIHLKRCYLNTFNQLSIDNINNDEYLQHCYDLHLQQVKSYFSDRPNDILFIDIAKANSFSLFCQFLNIAHSANQQFEKMNVGGKVTAWNAIKHPLKVESTAKGKIDKYIYPAQPAKF